MRNKRHARFVMLLVALFLTFTITGPLERQRRASSTIKDLAT